MKTEEHEKCIFQKDENCPIGELVKIWNERKAGPQVVAGGDPEITEMLGQLSSQVTAVVSSVQPPTWITNYCVPCRMNKLAEKVEDITRKTISVSD